MKARGRRAYTLIELLIGLAVGLLSLGLILSAIMGMVNATRTVRQHQADFTSANELMDALLRSSDSATAMFIPAVDILGTANTDGHALGFLAKGHADVPYFWQFVYDANAHTVTEYDYSNFSVPAPVAHGAPFVNVLAFSASRITADRLTDPFLQGYVPTSYELDTGFPGVKMGNTLYAVTLQVGPQQQRSAHLLPSTTVSGFNLVITGGSVGSPPPTPVGGPTPPSAGMVLIAVGVPMYRGVTGMGEVRYIGCKVIHIWVPVADVGKYSITCNGEDGGSGSGPPGPGP